MVKLFMVNTICNYDWSAFFLGAEYLHLPASWEYPKQHCEEAKAEKQREKKLPSTHTKRTSFHIPSSTLFTAILPFDGI